MKKLLATIAIATIIYSCSCTEKTSVLQPDPCAQYLYTIDSLNHIVKELEEEREILINEVSWREGEISYWGRKYDSIVELRK